MAGECTGPETGRIQEDGVDVEQRRPPGIGYHYELSAACAPKILSQAGDPRSADIGGQDAHTHPGEPDCLSPRRCARIVGQAARRHARVPCDQRLGWVLDQEVTVGETR